MIPPLIGLFFGLLWLFVGASAVGRPAGIAVGIAGVLLFAWAAWRVVRRGGRSDGRFVRKYYVAAVVLELVAIVAAQRWLVLHGSENLLFPIIGIIVGLHFIGLWFAMGRLSFLWLTGALVAINLLALLLPLSPEGRIMLAGFGSSTALLVAAST